MESQNVLENRKLSAASSLRRPGTRGQRGCESRKTQSIVLLVRLLG